MKLMTLELMKEKRRYKKGHNAIKSKRIEQTLFNELMAKLEDLLETNDKVMLEVHPSVQGDFTEVINERLKSMYDYAQVDKNKYIFYIKEITI